MEKEKLEELRKLRNEAYEKSQEFSKISSDYQKQIDFLELESKGVPKDLSGKFVKIKQKDFAGDSVTIFCKVKTEARRLFHGIRLDLQNVLIVGEDHINYYTEETFDFEYSDVATFEYLEEKNFLDIINTEFINFTKNDINNAKEA